MKYFFGSHVATDNGGACSSTAIRALIKQLIAAESGKKPLSDGQLAEVLSQQGIVVARRTVALLTGKDAVQQVHVPGSDDTVVITDALTHIWAAVDPQA